ncbi:MAG: 2Fe-2S iron-sulfur cluster-binding protein [Comamonadaceae bacterium]|nr:2Fe-2S iron-sulfur cluster-binding protein [Comamonadaceae bacterium]
MLDIEIDGKQVQVPDGSTVMDAADAARRLHPALLLPQEAVASPPTAACAWSQVEKAPKPLPACATPVTNGMKVHTHSRHGGQGAEGR